MNEEHEPQPSPQESNEVSPLRRRSHRRKSVYQRPASKGRLFFAIAFIGLLAIGGYYYQFYQTAHYAVMLNGKPLVALATEEQAQRAIQFIKEQHAPAAPEVVHFKEGELNIHTLTKPMAVSSVASAVDTLEERLTIVLDGAAIFVNRNPEVVLVDEESAGRAVSLMLQRGSAGKSGIPTIKERITIDRFQQTEGDKKIIPVVTPEEAAKKLVHPPVKNIYTVKKGDSFWTIANANGLTLNEIQALNPGVDHRKLDVGDPIKLPDRHSPITVVMHKSL